MPTPRKQTADLVSLPIDDIAGRLAKLRKLHGLTQQQLAEKIGITRELFSNYEKGRTRLTDEMIIRLTAALQVSADELLGIVPTTELEEVPSLRLARRMKELDQLPEAKKKAILKTLDDLIRANSVS